MGVEKEKKCDPGVSKDNSRTQGVQQEQVDVQQQPQQPQSQPHQSARWVTISFFTRSVNDIRNAQYVRKMSENQNNYH